eukprot:c14611_g1_i1 orf=107-916(+)
MGALAKAIHNVGFWVRETGQALDRLGSRLQGIYAFQEPLSRHRTIMNLYDKVPTVDKDVFLAPSVAVIGDVKVGHGSSIWYGCILRGDVNSISVGSNTNIQDNTLIHVSNTNASAKVLPAIIGSRVTIGHSSVLHGCTVEDEAFIGMGAVLLDGVYVERNAMVAAGSLVKQDTRIPCGEVWGGNPAAFLRKLAPEEIAFFTKSAERYSELANVHAQENSRTYEEIQMNKVLQKKWFLQSDPYDSHLGIVQEKAPAEIVFQDASSSKDTF